MSFGEVLWKKGFQIFLTQIRILLVQLRINAGISIVVDKLEDKTGCDDSGSKIFEPLFKQEVRTCYDID